MIFNYDELNNQRSKGTKLSWEEISKEQLRHLYVSERIPISLIANLYDVEKTQVSYKLNKFGIKYKEIIINNFIDNVPESANEVMKKMFFDNFDIDNFSKVITHYAFRNGPVEDMHAEGKLSQADMKTLNKYMVNRIAGILQLVKDEQWYKLVGLVELYKNFGFEWDKAEPDIDELNTCLKHIVNKLK